MNSGRLASAARIHAAARLRRSSGSSPPFTAFSAASRAALPAWNCPSACEIVDLDLT